MLAVVGPMQFEVASHRMEHEFGAAGQPGAPALLAGPAHRRGVRRRRSPRPAAPRCCARTDGELLALFTDKWSLRVLEQNKPHLTLTPLVAAQLA